MKYTVEIKETLSKLVQMEAPNSAIAQSLATSQYNNSEIILGDEDFINAEICVSDDAPQDPSYFKSDNRDFTLIKGDCVETLSKFKFSFDMVFADPPYFLSGGGISYHSGKVVCVDKGDWDKPKTPEEMDAFNFRWLSACRDHIKDNATIWITGTYHNIFSAQQQLIKLGFKILNVITWRKTNPPPNISCRYFTFSSEFVIWARKSPKVPHYYNYKLMRELNGGKQMTDVWSLPAIARWEKSCGKHPTQKPLPLLARIIQASTEPGAWILDPFSGSSTTGIAANLLDRKFLGLEIEDDYLALGKNRRLELENPLIRHRYLKLLAKSQVIPSLSSIDYVSEHQELYGLPW